jgi:hypothetical protein
MGADMTPEQQTPASVGPKTFKTNDPTNPLHRLADDLQCGRLKIQGVADDVTYALALIERLSAEREVARTIVDEMVGLLAPDQGEMLTAEGRRLFGLASKAQAALGL